MPQRPWHPADQRIRPECTHDESTRKAYPTQQTVKLSLRIVERNRRGLDHYSRRRDVAYESSVSNLREPPRLACDDERIEPVAWKILDVLECPLDAASPQRREVVGKHQYLVARQRIVSRGGVQARV